VTLATSTVRALGALSAALLTLGMLSACTPAPEPDAKPTKSALFASDEEAFKAAEETYRAYTDALNNVDTSDPETFEPVFEYTSGDFEVNDRKNLSIMHAEGFVMSGRTIVEDFRGTSTTADRNTVHGSVCVNVSDADIRDSDGASIVPGDRPDRYVADVTFVATRGVLSISHAETDEEKPCDAL